MKPDKQRSSTPNKNSNYEIKRNKHLSKRFNPLYKNERDNSSRRSRLLQFSRMTTYCGGSLVKWFALALLSCQVLGAPKSSEGKDEIKEIFSESKRDVSTGIGVVPLMKAPLFNPYMMYPPFVPGKPVLYPPFLPMTSSDVLLSRLGKSVATSTTGKPAFDGSDPSLMSAYFKAKKDEFLMKLLEKLTNSSATPGVAKRAASDDDAVEPTKPTLDSSFFLKKKYEFLNTLFKSLNVTPTPPVNTTDADTTNATSTSAAPTPKPTIVSPDFWFPFAKLPKPTKAPKPTKPPKAKKILKDALDTILLQSLLIDMGVDPKDTSLNKRAATMAGLSKKSKSKKVKAEEDPTEVFIPSKVDPTLYSSKASECLDKLFKILNKTDDEELDSYVKPKATVIPMNLWTKPSEVEYTSKLDAFLDLLIKSLNATEVPSEKPEKAEKSGKSKSKVGKKFMKRSTFLDELLHRVTPAPTTTTTPEPTIPPEDIIVPEDPECDIVQFLKECCGCGKNCIESVKSEKSARSLIFKPFGSGYWIPQYLYAAKMGMYLDKLMDTINTAAATEVESETSEVAKRSADPEASELPSKEAAINLIIAQLTELKNDIVDAFTEGIKAQKDATPTPKPFGGKSFKKPFWGPKALPTTDPIAPIQKRIDILNDVFDNLTKVEKTLIFTSEPEYDPKLLANLTEILELTNKPSKVHPKLLPTTPPENPDSPEYFLSKTREYLKTLYGKSQDSDDK